MKGDLEGGAGEVQPLLRHRRRTMAVERHEVLPEYETIGGGVLRSLFLTGDLKREDASTRQRISTERDRHSRLYLILDPKENSPEAKRYKYFITSLILLNVLVFILGTDDEFAARFQWLFDLIEAFSSWVFLVEYIVRLVIITEHKRFRDPLWGRLETYQEEQKSLLCFLDDLGLNL